MAGLPLGRTCDPPMADSQSPIAGSRMIQLTDQPIETDALVAQCGHPEAGAVLLFLGTTREITDGRQTVALDYEAYAEMAERRLAELEAEARRRWPVLECVIVHRLGRVPVTEASVAIVVSTPHRRDAFAASEWLIDTLKSDVPIWKREQWADGTMEWVHPGMAEDKETRKQGGKEEGRDRETRRQGDKETV